MRRLAPPVLLAVSLAVAAPPAPAHAYVALAPLRDVLHGARGDLVSCRTRDALPDGRYVVALRLDEWGKVVRFELVRRPAPLTAAACSCLEAAFTRLRFPASARARPERERRRGPGEHTPPDLRHRVSGDGPIFIRWPFVFAAPRREG